MLPEDRKLSKKGYARQVLTPPLSAVESTTGWKSWGSEIRAEVIRLKAVRKSYEKTSKPGSTLPTMDLNELMGWKDSDTEITFTFDSDFEK